MNFKKVKMKTGLQTVEEYIQTFPAEIQSILLRLRQMVVENAPEADESIAYGMPAYKLNKKPLVYFAAFKNHIGLYALPSGHEKFKTELASFKQGKGSVQFPLDRVPFDLIQKMIDFRVRENQSK